MNHTTKMVIGCLLPLLLIFLLPYFGVTEGWGIFLFIVFMFGCHLFMMRGHDHGDHEDCETKQGGNHGDH